MRYAIVTLAAAVGATLAAAAPAYAAPLASNTWTLGNRTHSDPSLNPGGYHLFNPSFNYRPIDFENANIPASLKPKLTYNADAGEIRITGTGWYTAENRLFSFSAVYDNLTLDPDNNAIVAKDSDIVGTLSGDVVRPAFANFGGYTGISFLLRYDDNFNIVTDGWLKNAFRDTEYLGDWHFGGTPDNDPGATSSSSSSTSGSSGSSSAVPEPAGLALIGLLAALAARRRRQA